MCGAGEYCVEGLFTTLWEYSVEGLFTKHFCQDNSIAHLSFHSPTMPIPNKFQWRIMSNQAQEKLEADVTTPVPLNKFSLTYLCEFTLSFQGLHGYFWRLDIYIPYHLHKSILHFQTQFTAV